MNTEMVNQVTEVIKNISIAFDGKLNSETLVQITNTVTPQVVNYLYFLQIKNIVINLMWMIGVVISAYLIGKQLLVLSKEKK